MARTKLTRGRKWIIAIGSIVLLIGALAGAGALVVTAPAPSFPTDGAPDDNRWYQQDLGDRAITADGSDYRIYVKTAASDNLMIFFGGGGVTWDAASAHNPITTNKFLFSDDPGNYFANIPAYFPRTLGGMLEADNPENPFTDWNIVMIPYATGDFHTGTGTQELEHDGATTVMHYNGQTNVRLALDWIGEHLPATPPKLLIAGGSAGGFGATFWTPTIARAYPDSTVYSFSEGNQLPNPDWPEVADELWMADWKRTFGYEPGANLYETAAIANRELVGDNIVFLDSNTLRDGTLISFWSTINGVDPDADVWSSEMRESMRRLDATVDNYYYFLTDDGADDSGLTPHTLSSLPAFYTTSQDGVAFSDWLADAVIRDEPRSVGADLLGK